MSARARSAAMPPKTSSTQAGVKRSKPSHITAAQTPTPAATAQSTGPSLPEPVFFFKPDDPEAGFLSQWYSSPFSDPSDPSVVFPSAEHYMMYHKALLFDTSAAAGILEAMNASEVRALGRQVAGFDESVWNENKMRIVTEGNRLKFSQGSKSEQLRGRLLATADRDLVEASPTDRTWGIGLSAEKAASSDRKNWGKNLLGTALMTVRKELLAEEDRLREEAERR
ncbi:N-glycosidase like protein [Verticillium longisporum]